MRAGTHRCPETFGAARMRCRPGAGPGEGLGAARGLWGLRPGTSASGSRAGAQSSGRADVCRRGSLAGEGPGARKDTRLCLQVSFASGERGGLRGAAPPPALRKPRAGARVLPWAGCCLGTRLARFLPERGDATWRPQPGLPETGSGRGLPGLRRPQPQARLPWPSPTPAFAFP